MKKILFFCAAAVLNAAAQDFRVPYSSVIGVSKDACTATKKGIDPYWESIDVDGDGSFVQYTKYWKDTWAYPSTFESEFLNNGYHPGVTLSRGATSPATYNDYIVSPPIDMAASKTYRVRFAVYTPNNCALTLTGSLTAGQEEDEVVGQPVFFSEKFETGAKWVRRGYVFSPESDGAYCIAIGCNDTKAARIDIADFSVVEDSFVPARPLGLTATEGTAEDARHCSVTLAWTLPTADRDGQPFADGQTIESVNIYRDGSELPVATLPADATQWTDTGDTGLRPGNHVYNVTVTVAGTEGEAATVLTQYAGPVEPMSLPADFVFVSQSDFDLLWHTQTTPQHTATTTSSQWKFSLNTAVGNSLAMLSQAGTASKPIVEDAWAFSPEMQFDQAGTYTFRNASCYYKASKPSFDTVVRLELGTGTTADGWQKVATISEKLPYTYTPTLGPVERDPINFEVPAPGTYRLAFHADGPGNGVAYRFYKFSVSKYGTNAAQTIDVEATPPVYYNLQGFRVMNPQSGQLVIERRGGNARVLIFR